MGAEVLRDRGRVEIDSAGRFDAPLGVKQVGQRDLDDLPVRGVHSRRMDDGVSESGAEVGEAGAVAAHAVTVAVDL